MTVALTRLCLFVPYILWLACGVAYAQWQPTRPVQIIVPNPPGGGPDFIARLLAPKLSESIRQNAVVDNRSSNNGIVGAEAAARGAPDGSSMIIGNSGTHAIMLAAGVDMKNIPYKGGAPATIAILSGESDMTLTNYVAVAKHIEATGHTITNNAPEQFSDKVRSEVEKFRKIIIASKRQQD